jgi:chorismate mutase
MKKSILILVTYMATIMANAQDLKVNRTNDNQDEFTAKVTKLREEIDVIDSNLLSLLEKRMKVATEIGLVKKDTKVNVIQSNRWNEVLGKMILEGNKKGLTEEFIRKVFEAIHQESIEHQKKVISR